MSAFMVETVTIDRVVCALSTDSRPVEIDDELGRNLIRLNAAAVRARYGHDKEVLASLVSEDEIAAWTYSGRLFDPVEQLVALQCLIYQCTEGDVPKTTLYAELRNAERRLLQKVVEENPRYAAAQKTCWK